MRLEIAIFVNLAVRMQAQRRAVPGTVESWRNSKLKKRTVDIGKITLCSWWLFGAETRWCAEKGLPQVVRKSPDVNCI